MAEYIDPMKPLIEEFIGEFRLQKENHIMRAVADVGIVVDKPRLMKALTDAQSFYEEGYRAAMNKADVVEVRHGEWAKKNDDFSYWYVCSACGHAPPQNNWGHEYHSVYCPNCGAKMDGKGDTK